MSSPEVPLRRIDHVRFFVGNARQSAYFYRNAFGFDVVAYAGLETGSRQEAGYVLKQGDITFVLASPLSADHPEAERLIRHGDGAQSIALEVDDVNIAYEASLAHGAIGVSPPDALEDEHGVYEYAVIQAYGHTTHTFVNRDKYRGVFAPGYEVLNADRYGPRVSRNGGLKTIDHIVANVEEGKMREWVEYYAHVMGFSLLVSFDDKDISTEYTALMSKVVQDGRGRIKFPINEPAKGRRRSQIDEFLHFHGGPGVQHIALSTDDIVETVRSLRRTTSRSSACRRPITNCSPIASARSTKTSPNSPNSASSSIATTKAISYKSSPSRSKTALPSSSKSSSATARKASAEAISRPSSKPSSANRREEGRSECKIQEFKIQE